MVQSLDFAASLSSFFLCQLAAPILNLGGGDHRSARPAREPKGADGERAYLPLDVIKVRKLLLEFLQLGFHKPVIRVRLLRSSSTS